MVVLGRAQEQLWRAVPARSDVVGEDRVDEFFDSLDPPSQPKVRQLDLTLFIYQNIGWLQVPVDDLRRVNILESTQQLPSNIADLDIAATAGTDHSVQIGIHELKNYVDIDFIWCFTQVYYVDDVFVIAHFLIQKYLPISSLCICIICESIKYFFYRNDSGSLLLNSFPDDAIGSLAYFLKGLVLVENGRVNVLDPLFIVCLVFIQLENVGFFNEIQLLISQPLLGSLI